jgi:hypothetical protein
MKNKIAKEMEVIANKTHMDGLSLNKRLMREKQAQGKKVDK